MKQNVVGWFEIYVSDMGRARKFYESVLNTALEKLEVDSMEMWMFPWHDGAPGSGGALAKMEGVSPGNGGTMIYFVCEDCAVEESRVVPNGGEVVMPKFAIGVNGFVSIVKDTEGNCIGLHSMQ